MTTFWNLKSGLKWVVDTFRQHRDLELLSCVCVSGMLESWLALTGLPSSRDARDLVFLIAVGLACRAGAIVLKK